MLVINKDNIDDLELELRFSLSQCWIQDFRDYDKLDNLQELINLNHIDNYEDLDDLLSDLRNQEEIENCFNE